MDITNFPHYPGCYLFKDSAGNIIYIGKAVDLRKRVSQYFQSKNGDNPKVRKLVTLIADAGYIGTETEIEALFLEFKLVKQHRPIFNVSMNKDWKPHLLCIQADYKKPGVYTSKVPPVNAVCFRIFRRGMIGSNPIKAFNDIWGTPICGRKHFDEPINNSCFRYILGKCAGPCRPDADVAEYRRILDDICGFLKNENDNVLDRLKSEMNESSENYEYEKAALLRDQYDYLVNTRRYTQDSIFSFVGKKVCVFVRGYHEQAFVLCYVDDEKIKLTEHFISPEDFSDDAEESFARKIFDETLNGSAIKNPASPEYPEIEVSMGSLMEMGAKRLIVDVTRAGNVNDVICELRNSYIKFFAGDKR